MKKRMLILAMCLGLAVSSISGCASAGEKQEVTKVSQETENKYQMNDNAQEGWAVNAIPEEAKVSCDEETDKYERQMYINSLKPSEPLNLTIEQKLEDFDLFWDTVREKIFCLEEIAESRGVNLEKHVAAYREMMANSKSDVEFYEILQKSIGIFNKVWHMGIYEPYAMLDAAVEEYLRLKDPDLKGSCYEGLINEEDCSKLKYWDILLTRNINQYKEAKSRTEVFEPAMPELKIINDKIAVITIPTMLYGEYEEKVDELLDKYMKDVSDFENVIFDLKSNGGGHIWFPYNSIVAPNIDEPLTFSSTSFFKNADDIKIQRPIYFSRPITITEPSAWRENYIQFTVYPDILLSDLPDELKKENGEYGNADFFGKMDIKIFPKYNKKVLNGKVWVLTYEENYSAAEGFVNVCRETGFATLVGKQTAGDGDYLGSHSFKLPNSGLLWGVSTSWRLNEDGSCNSSEGTKPDIESPEGESPLETCLRVIEEYEKEN